MVHGTSATTPDHGALAATIKAWGRELGFQAVGIAHADLGAAEPGLAAWLAAGFHGEMEFMRRHGARRARPHDLVPGTVRVISARMDYLPEAADGRATLADGAKAFVWTWACAAPNTCTAASGDRLMNTREKISSVLPIV